MGLVSGLSLANHSDSESFLMVRALLSRDGCQWEVFWEVIVAYPFDLSRTFPVGGASLVSHMASLVAQMIKNLPEMQETQVWPLGQEDPLEKEWRPTSVFLPGEFYGQRSLAGYSPWGYKELDMTEWLSLHFPGWWWLITSMFLIRTSCCKITHATSYYGAWPGWVVLVNVLLVTLSLVPEQGKEYYLLSWQY